VPGFVPVIDHPDIPRILMSYANLITAKERAGIERATSSTGISMGRFSPELMARVRQLIDQQETLFQAFERAADPTTAASLRATLAGPAAAKVQRMRDIILAGGERGEFQGLIPPEWFAASTARIDQIKQMEDRISGDRSTSRIARRARRIVTSSRPFRWSWACSRSVSFWPWSSAAALSVR